MLRNKGDQLQSCVRALLRLVNPRRPDSLKYIRIYLTISLLLGFIVDFCATFFKFSGKKREFVDQAGNYMVTLLDRALIAALLVVLASFGLVQAGVVVARVDRNGPSAGLLPVGSRILYLNTTQISVNQDVTEFLSSTRPGEKVLVTTNSKTILVELGGNTSGKLGIGIINFSRSTLYEEEAGSSRPELPRPPDLWKPGYAGIGVAMGAFLASILVLGRYGMKLGTVKIPKLEPTTLRGFLVVLFGCSLAIRLAHNIGYLLRFGWHAANVMELWFYVDVAKGNPYFLHPLNPTVHILRVFGLLSPEAVPFYATIACGILLASLVPILLFILVGDLHGRKAGLYSGLIYAFMIQPVVLSTVSFTQHLTQIPIALLFLTVTNRAIASKGRTRYLYVLSMVLTASLGYLINVEIIIYVVLAYFLVFTSVVRWFLRDRGIDGPRSFALMMLAVVLILMPVHLYFDEISSFSSGLTLKNTSRGSAPELVNPTKIDFVTAIPLPLEVDLRFYSVFLVLLPFGVYLCWQRRDLTPYLLFAFGFVASLHWTRGSRITDLGVAALAGLALAYFESRWRLPILFVAAPLAAMSIFFFPGSDLQPYVVLSLIALVLSLSLTTDSRRRGATLAVCVVYCMSLTSVGFFFLRGLRQEEPMYQALDWLATHSNEGERILTSLDRGHIPNPIADLDSVSNEFDPSPEIAKAFFEPEELAAITLLEHNVTYVMVSSDDLRVGTDATGKGIMNFQGYVLYEADFEEWEYSRTLAFRLTYPDSDLEYFEELRAEEREGTIVRVYRLRKEAIGPVDRPPPASRVTVSLLLRNPNQAEVEAWIPLMIADKYGKPRILDSLVVSLAPLGTVSLAIDYDIAPEEGLILEIDSNRVETHAPSEVRFGAAVEATRAGAYMLFYEHAGGARNATVLLEEGAQALSLGLNGISSLDLPLRSLSIERVEIPGGEGEVDATLPARVLDPVQIVFAHID